METDFFKLLYTHLEALKAETQLYRAEECQDIVLVSTTGIYTHISNAKQKDIILCLCLLHPFHPLISTNISQIGTKGVNSAKTGAVLRFTWKFPHAIMVMLKAVPKSRYPFHLRNICQLQMFFFAQNLFIHAMPAWQTLKNEKDPSVFIQSTGGKSLKTKKTIRLL